MVDFKFPDVGEGITEGKLLKWMVSVGDSVKEDQPLAEVETDKAVVEVPSPHGGKITKLHANAGDVIKVGSVLVTFDGGESEGDVKEEVKESPKGVEKPKEEVKPAPKEEPQEGPKTEQKPVPVEPVVKETPKEEPAPSEQPTETPKETKTETSKVAQTSKRVLATPHTRRLARELGVDISKIQGSGPAGRVTDEDLKGGKKISAPEDTPKSETPTQTASETTTPSQSLKPTSIEGGRREPMSSVRKAIANKMSQSYSHAVHVTHCDEVDITFLVRIRNKQKEHARKQGVKLTYLPFIAKAAFAAIRKFPQFNASLDEAKQELVFHERMDLGMALATDYGLIVPVIRDADHKSILDLGREMHELADRGRARRLKPEEMKNSTFTVTNVGSIGGTIFTPIINYPEAAILGVGRIQELPRINNGKVESRHILHLSLSFDHRIADGAEAAKFMNEIKAHLEDPSLMLIDVI